jgi:hypothetical protein
MGRDQIALLLIWVQGQEKFGKSENDLLTAGNRFAPTVAKVVRCHRPLFGALCARKVHRDCTSGPYFFTTVFGASYRINLGDEWIIAQAGLD